MAFFEPFFDFFSHFVGMPPPAAIPPAFPNYSQPTSLSGLSLPMSGSIGTNFQTFQPSGQDYRHAQGFGANFHQNNNNNNIGNGVASQQILPQTGYLPQTGHLPQTGYLDPQMPNLIPTDLQPKFEFAPPNKNISEVSALQGYVSTSKSNNNPQSTRCFQTRSFEVIFGSKTWF